jgi:hypothetical protein
MLTAHRLSFPTCLFHPRSIHLLCHLDSPSAANLPCLGLQQQTGPEVSELCGSYRVPSRSSLLPLRTLSPGESRSQAKQPVLPTSITSLTWRECCTTGQQATRSPALRGHNNQWGKQTRAFQQVQQWQDGLTYMASDKIPHIGSRSVQTEDVSAFQKSTQTIPKSTQDFTRFQNGTRYLQRFRRCTRVSLQRSDQFTSGSRGSNGGGTPSRLILALLFACTRVDTCHPCNCMHSISMHSFHLEVCPLPKELRIKT